MALPLPFRGSVRGSVKRKGGENCHGSGAIGNGRIGPVRRFKCTPPINSASKKARLGGKTPRAKAVERVQTPKGAKGHQYLIIARERGRE